MHNSPSPFLRSLSLCTMLYVTFHSPKYFLFSNFASSVCNIFLPNEPQIDTARLARLSRCFYVSIGVTCLHSFQISCRALNPMKHHHHSATQRSYMWILLCEQQTLLSSTRSVSTRVSYTLSTCIVFLFLFLFYLLICINKLHK